MELFTKRKPGSRVVDLVQQRELQESAARSISRKLKVTPNFLKRLGLETELEGHEGCVNCLEWNESGSMLASASDDMRVILWDPFSYKVKYNIQTGHSGNIFTVKFLPNSNDSILVTGAGDYKIRVHDISISDILLVCNCHYGRVKRFGTAPGVPFLFWSASEDGLIMQYDIRVPHSCKSNVQKNVLINLSNHTGRFTEAKCINVNPRRPELIAVGASDAYIRMYDRRMIKLSNSPDSTISNSNVLNLGKGDYDNNVPLACAQYFIAGHLRYKDNCKKYCTTYLTFSDDGNELLVNMGAEQIYLFDINNHGNSRNFIVPVELITNDGDGNEPIVENSNTPVVLEDLSSINFTDFSPEVEELQKRAKQAFKEERYANAVTLYNDAIDLCPNAAILYGNRAGTYMKRAWDGDIYAALRDCRVTLALDPEHVKAHFRMARCLFDLNRVKEANIVMKNFAEKFPEFTNNSACKSLRKDIKEAMNTNKESQASKQSIEVKISDYEREWRKNAIDFKLRLCGHCNTITDIKEANFFGDDGQFIIAGSDDGSFFIWDRYTTNIARVLKGDQRIVNCLQPHPSMCLLATSGIDPVIRLWSPMPEDGSVNVWEVENSNDAAIANHIRMNTDHYEVMFFNMGYRFPGQGSGNGQDDNEDRQDSSNTQPLNCRPS
ncbi:WD and tetratricopeptide repeats protein 1-like [Phymastichus coffea]|uniref:WD and tetratricopeptide repeats protein 1-like n=1 Tax=Phymastichus coffea TaxID=108790 RepID=UPI00273AB4EA|nr:WD and tetratricopeptide repeats protein 1-like [Phymastichus coffea]